MLGDLSEGIEATATLSTSMKSSSKSTGSSIIYGVLLTKMVRLLMYTFRPNGMVQRLSDSSGACYEAMAVNLEKS
jgi:hypothetical protein